MIGIVDTLKLIGICIVVNLMGRAVAGILGSRNARREQWALAQQIQGGKTSSPCGPMGCNVNTDAPVNRRPLPPPAPPAPPPVKPMVIIHRHEPWHMN